MGQYHMAINLTKGEYLKPVGWAKLMEHSYFANSYTMRLSQLLSPKGSWHGDNIVVAGDYTEFDDMDIPDKWNTPEMRTLFRNIYVQEYVNGHIERFKDGERVDSNGKHYRVGKSAYTDKQLATEIIKITNEAECDFIKYSRLNIYDFALTMFKQIKITKANERKFDELRAKGLPALGDEYLINNLQNARYFLNANKKEFIDCYDAIPQDMANEKMDIPSYYLFPLTILLSVSNGRGGGDYSGYYLKTPDGDYIRDQNENPVSVTPGEEYIGAWAGDSIKAVNDVKRIPADYKHIDPGFTERKEPIKVKSTLEILSSKFPNAFSLKECVV